MMSPLKDVSVTVTLLSLVWSNARQKHVTFMEAETWGSLLTSPQMRKQRTLLAQKRDSNPQDPLFLANACLLVFTTCQKRATNEGPSGGNLISTPLQYLTRSLWINSCENIGDPELNPHSTAGNLYPTGQLEDGRTPLPNVQPIRQPLWNRLSW